MPRYDPKRIENHWQKFWEEHRTFFLPDDVPENDAQKLYVLDMFPYPSGSGLHVGHPEGYTATDIVVRHARMNGKLVLHPMGWDAFGLPAEEHAVKTGTHPRETTEQNIGTFRRQLQMLGFSYDWSREISTTDPAYYRWTQWIFLQLFDSWYDAEFEWTGPDGTARVGKGRPISELPIPHNVQSSGDEAVRRFQDRYRLAYISEAPVNWCPALGTVLANEEVIDGLSERGGHPVKRIPLRQWMLRITAYADRLESELDHLNWPESIKLLQRNWIGRSTGAEVDFYIGAAHVDDWKASRAATGCPEEPGDDVLRVYTTRPDTLYGATYMVIAPEHPLVDRLTTDEHTAAVQEYCRTASLKSDLDRTDLAKEKSGVFTGSFAVNPVNGEQIPVWVADYVLISYGTGAIMAVPAHDLRDFEFAVQFELPIIPVVQPPAEWTPSKDESALTTTINNQQLSPFAGQGTAINSAEYDGTPTATFRTVITESLTSSGLGQAAVNYKLRDWLFSRQRYWGEPFPIWHELDDNGNPTGLMRAESADSLPVPHPHMEDFQPTGNPEPMLSKAPDDWLYRTDEDGTRLKRETNSMPQWAGSCWYYLRFCDPTNSETLIDPNKEKFWLPVDLYVGGAEHAVLHLLYARFWHKLLFDRGHVSTPEPFSRLVNQGMILGENGEKMSKSRGNVINPDDVVREYGADSLRLYEMFMGPLEQVKPWSTHGVEGVYRFLGRVWRMVIDDRAEHVSLNAAVSDSEPTEEQSRLLHKTIKAVSADVDRLSFNTAISRMMEFTNFMGNQDDRPQAVLEPFVLLLSPFAPHLAEELWQVLGHTESLAYESWPQFDDALLIEDTVEIPVQVNGKLRTKIQVPNGADQAALQSAAEANETMQQQLAGRNIVKVIAVPGRMINFVVR
ncbi:MAG: leucine--tRNA ligase [Planctomycetaceae bacterium]